MKKIDQVVSKVDIFAQPLEINFEPDKKHGIYIPFVATLALVIIISASTISSLVDLFNYKKVTMTGYRELFAQTEPMKVNISMAIKLRDIFSSEYLSVQFESVLQIVDYNDTSIIPVKIIPLYPCTRSHWKDISDEEFNRLNILDYYCPNETDGLSIALTQVSQLRRSIFLTVKENIEFPQVQYHIILLNQKSVDKQKLAFENSVKQFTFYNFYSQDKSMIVKIPNIVTNIKDDSSFFPFSSPINKTIATLDSPTIDYQQQSQDIFRLEIYIGGRILEYERSVGKITNVLAEVGGLYTVVFGIFSIVVLVYYNHKLRLKLAESTFKNNKNSIKPSDYGFIKSLRYGTRGIAKPNENSDFGKECKRIEQNLNEVNSLVHIETMLNRLLIIESTLEESEGKDQFICSRLLEKSSVKKIQRKRLSIEYLSYIAQGRNSITLRDARRMYNGLGMSLKDFLNRRLKHRMQQEMKADEGKGKLGQSVESDNRIVNSDIETPQQIETQNFVVFKENQSGLNTLQKVINQFRDIKAEAEQVQMTPEFAKIEVSLAKAFYKMKQKARAKKQQKIPIIILHRLMRAIFLLSMKKEERQDKAREKGSASKAQNVQRREEQEQEEESSNSSDCFEQDD